MTIVNDSVIWLTLFSIFQWIPLSDLEDFKKNRILYPAESLR